MRIRTLTAALLVCASITLAFAQPTTWHSAGMGGGGAFFSPSINPSNGSEMFVASDMSDIFRTTNLGASWSTLDFRQLQSSNLCGKIHFTNNTFIRYTLNAAGDRQRPAKSTNGGVTWDALMADPTGSQAISMIVDPQNLNILFVADYNHLYFSGTGGNTFKAIDSLKTPNGFHLAGACFNDSTIVVGSNRGLLVSTNAGGTWVSAGVPGILPGEVIMSLTGGTQGSVARLLCVTMNASDVFAGMTGAEHGSYRGIYTCDLTLTPSWTPRSAGIPIGVQPFFAMMCPSNSSVMYLAGGSDVNTPTVYKSSDGGATWGSTFVTTNNQNIATGWSGDHGDRGWSYGEYALGFTVSSSDPNRLMLTDLGFVHASIDGGQSWRQTYVASGDQNPAGSSTPTGKAYHGVGLENTTNWQVTWIDSLNMFACFSDMRGVRSTDGGVTWSQDYTGLNANSTYRALYSPEKLELFVATSSAHDLYQSTTIYDSKIDAATGQVLFSTDLGHTFQLLHDFGHPVVWIAVDPSNTSRMYASVVHSVDGGIYVCNDIGQGIGSVWTKVSAPPRTEGHPFNIVVLKNGELVTTFSARKPTPQNSFTKSSGVFYSTNRGATWIDRSDSAMMYWTRDIIIDPSDPSQNTWYAGVFSGWGGGANDLGGLFRTTNRGVSWSRLLSNLSITSTTVHPDNPEVMYVTSETNGLLYTSNLSAATPSFTALASYLFRQPERVVFNPYNHAEIWISSFGNGISHSSGVAIPLPDVPVLLFPDSAATGVGLNEMLQWNVSNGGTSYQIQVARDSLFAQKLHDSTGLAQPQYRLWGMTWNTKYYWRVRASGSGGTSAWSAPWSFQIERLSLQTPFKVILNLPFNNDQVAIPPTRFIWYPTQPSIDRYALEIASDEAFTTMQADTSITDTSGVVTSWSIPVNGPHWWRVRGHNVAGWGAYSDAWQYEVIMEGVEENDPVPIVPMIESIAPNPFTEDAMVRISIPENDRVSLKLFDLLGNLVATLHDGSASRGVNVYRIRLDVERSGAYLLKLTTSTARCSKMITRLK